MERVKSNNPCDEWAAFMLQYMRKTLSQYSMCSPWEMACYYSLKEEDEEEEGYRCFLNQNIDLSD